MTASAAFVALFATNSLAVSAEGTSDGGGNPPPLVCTSLLRSSSCYVGDEIQWSLGASGGVPPYNYGFIYMETEQEIPVVVGVLLDTNLTSALNYEGLFLGDPGHYRFQFYVQDSTGAYAYSTYQYLMVHAVSNTNPVISDILAMLQEESSLPDMESVSTPALSVSDFSVPQLSVDDDAWNLMDSGLSNILPVSLGALLVPTIIFLFLGRWLNK